MVKSRVPRPPRRRHVLIALLAVAGLTSGCTVASTEPGSNQSTSPTSIAPTMPAASILPSAPPSSGSIIPWADRPAAEYVWPTPEPLPTNARPCRPTDLKVTAGGVGAGMGNTDLRVEFANTSHSACLLIGSPTIGGLRADGTLVPLPVTEGSYFGDPGPAANIEPAEVAAVNISGADACTAIVNGKHRVYPKLRIGLPGGGSADIAARGFDTVCGVSVSRFGVPADLVPVPDPPRSPLTARISGPTTAAAGQTIIYTVTLVNPSASDVPLSPCPAYDEFVGSGTTVWLATVLHYYLNCDAATVILAGGSATFEMRLALPADQPPGMAKFGWDIQGGGGPGANAELEVKPAGS